MEEKDSLHYSIRHELKIAYMRGYQVGRRFEKRKAKQLLKKSKGI